MIDLLINTYHKFWLEIMIPAFVAFIAVDVAYILVKNVIQSKHGY